MTAGVAITPGAVFGVNNTFHFEEKSSLCYAHVHRCDELLRRLRSGEIQFAQAEKELIESKKLVDEEWPKLTFDPGD
jgi:hypothetical protein